MQGERIFIDRWSVVTVEIAERVYSTEKPAVLAEFGG